MRCEGGDFSTLVLYVCVVIKHGTGRLVHMNVSGHPSADWTCGPFVAPWFLTFGKTDRG